MPTQRLTIGAAATRSGLTPKAVRLYEARGLIQRTDRTAAGYRLYDEADVTVLSFIRQARALGLNLEEIRRILDLRRAGTAPCSTVRGLLDDKIHQIDQTIADLTALRETLISTRTATETSAASICGVIENPADTT